MNDYDALAESAEDSVETAMQQLIWNPFRDFATPHLKELRQLLVLLIDDAEIANTVASDHLMQDQMIKIKMFALDLEALENLSGCGASLEDIVGWCPLDLWSLKKMAAQFVDAVGKYFICQSDLLTDSELKLHDFLAANGFLQWRAQCCEAFEAFCNDMDTKITEFFDELPDEKALEVARQIEKYKEFMIEEDVYKKMSLFAEMADDDYQ